HLTHFPHLSSTLHSRFFLFFFYCYRPHRALHSFPTRRSSDLKARPLSWPSSGLRWFTASIQMRRLHSVWSMICIDRPTDGSRSLDRKSTRLNSSHLVISYAVFCLKKKKNKTNYRFISI